MCNNLVGIMEKEIQSSSRFETKIKSKLLNSVTFFFNFLT